MLEVAVFLVAVFLMAVFLVAVFLVAVLFPSWYMSQNACYFFPLVFSLLSICQPLRYLPKYPLCHLYLPKTLPLARTHRQGRPPMSTKSTQTLQHTWEWKPAGPEQGALLSGKTQHALPTLSAYKGVKKQSHSENIKKIKCSNFWFPFHELFVFEVSV